MNGIDIASYQAGIDLTKIKDANGQKLDFVIIKASQGKTYRNPAFTAQLESARRAGLKIGIYHYYDNNGTYEEQATLFYEMAQKAPEASLWLDWESEQNSKNWRNAKTALSFIKTINAKTNKKCGLYTSKSFLSDFKNYDVTDIKLWMAQYPNMRPVTTFNPAPWTDQNSYLPWKEANIHQYSSTGRLNGWNANLDLNKCFMTLDEWDEMAQTKTKKKKKTYTENAEAAAVVLKGDMGNGETRKRTLIALGFNYDTIQRIVNEIIRITNEEK